MGSGLKEGIVYTVGLVGGGVAMGASDIVPSVSEGTIVTQQLDVLPLLSTSAEVVEAGMAPTLAAAGFVFIILFNYLAQRTTRPW